MTRTLMILITCGLCDRALGRSCRRPACPVSQACVQLQPFDQESCLCTSVVDSDGTSTCIAFTSCNRLSKQICNEIGRDCVPAGQGIECQARSSRSKVPVLTQVMIGVAVFAALICMLAFYLLYLHCKVKQEREAHPHQTRSSLAEHIKTTTTTPTKSPGSKSWASKRSGHSPSPNIKQNVSPLANPFQRDVVLPQLSAFEMRRGIQPDAAHLGAEGRPTNPLACQLDFGHVVPRHSPPSRPLSDVPLISLEEFAEREQKRKSISKIAATSTSALSTYTDMTTVDAADIDIDESSDSDGELTRVEALRKLNELAEINASYGSTDKTTPIPVVLKEESNLPGMASPTATDLEPVSVRQGTSLHDDRVEEVLRKQYGVELTWI
eukprot:TRINITY_DN6923_c0_g1_i1.p1 TRINITY_DN6923_c0_g1~~TRINITY_DN6923_c0_g1_i1.p1  ORF type:complete len:381 (+),score=56.92 TRINITY_DN6923_c0_g1_i1:97-1239(+)